MSGMNRKFVAFEGTLGPVYFNPGHVRKVTPMSGPPGTEETWACVWTDSTGTTVKGDPATIVMHLEEEL